VTSSPSALSLLFVALRRIRAASGCMCVSTSGVLASRELLARRRSQELPAGEASSSAYAGEHGEGQEHSSLLPQSLLPSVQSLAFGGVDSSSFIQVDEVPSQQEVMNGFGEMQGEPC